ncbi:pectate lyase [Catalinimonas alkaloidigena]|uniref:Pectate lyase n=1 Tax=Catalinimonas alkaloidigena TaxID=1075417 RepID=A0A1G9S7N3_9BACT|nr:T9SS type A sorting domain-containing protein [Catalinimonas alkaloidigena]SDM31464.1 pectate lyase [Catalinimonas alkaloidigena]
MRKGLPLFLLLTLLAFATQAQHLIIEENAVGFCSVDGIIESGTGGYTGDGYANPGNGIGINILYNVQADTAGTYSLTWRYANGGGSGDLFAQVWVADEAAVDSLNFRHTGSWANWTYSDTVRVALQAGENKIRLVSQSPNGLPNLDHFAVLSTTAQGAACLPSYSVTLTQNTTEGGTISYEPVQAYYDAGTEITLHAEAAPGYFFQSWSGDVTSTEADYTFAIGQNSAIEALFFTEGTAAFEGVSGYASVQDDAGTPYLLTGGGAGPTVQATTFEELKQYLESNEPYVIEVAGLIVGADPQTDGPQVSVKSDKTLLGTSPDARLQNVRLKVGGARNVVFKKMKFSLVKRYDAMELNAAQNILIDSCEYFSDRESDHDKDYYDGLLDIKNGARFITVSHTAFHDHHKAILISSGDDSYGDTTIRVTFHHNYFYNISSRLPLLRFGRAHIYNNYYRNNDGAINPRLGACVRIENNYFENTRKGIFIDQSKPGYAYLAGNIWDESGQETLDSCGFTVPYPYELDDAEGLPALLAPLATDTDAWLDQASLTYFPNPATESTQLRFTLTQPTAVALRVFDALGKEIMHRQTQQLSPGEQTLTLHTRGWTPGIYVFHLQTPAGLTTRKLVVQ